MKQHLKYGAVSRWVFGVWLKGRRLLWKPRCRVFSPKCHDAINCIRIINLDRHTSRRVELDAELGRIVDRNGQPLCALSKRFAAIDAKNLTANYSLAELEPYYSLADQLFVEPDQKIPIEVVESNQHIEMSRQEVAVALSHISVWKEVAAGEHGYVLVLEDDVYFIPGFAGVLEDVWRSLERPFDILYLSYQEGRSGIQVIADCGSTFRPRSGLWQLSGYVLSIQGARKLLDRLPVRGPVDLWINLQFQELNVYAAQKSIVAQRPDGVSSNSYSILPVLSKVGVLEDGVALFTPQELSNPVFVFGPDGSGFTSVASALSLLGYRCCSDAKELCGRELERLYNGVRDRAFDAYVNVGSLNSEALIEMAKLYPSASFVFLVQEPDGQCRWKTICEQIERANGSLLRLRQPKRWKQLCDFLNCNLPVCDFPEKRDLGQRATSSRTVHQFDGKQLRFDVSPWILPVPLWSQNRVTDSQESEFVLSVLSDFGSDLDQQSWRLLHETFPSNLAYFQPGNFVRTGTQSELRLKKEDVSLRTYTSASIASQATFLFGRFTARLQASNVPGVVTGVFLHRNSPRQEIDVEILGKDPTKMLTNVFYNPGGEGAKYDYGYRGTPIQVDLGFDASAGLHDFTIEWTPASVRWFVDSTLVHERTNWAPTPIPNMPMTFFVNLWASKSQEFAGGFQQNQLPTSCCLDQVRIESYEWKPESV